MFEYVFVSSIDALLVLLFSFLCFLLLVKEDSPLRQNMDSEYFNLQEYEANAPQEDLECLESRAASQCSASQVGSERERFVTSIATSFKNPVFKHQNHLEGLLLLGRCHWHFDCCRPVPRIIPQWSNYRSANRIKTGNGIIQPAPSWLRDRDRLLHHVF